VPIIAEAFCFPVFAKKQIVKLELTTRDTSLEACAMKGGIR
jgi:hypothetical protein